MTDSDKDSFIQGIADIANKKEIVFACEPHVMNHKQITPNDVMRVLYAQKLIMDKYEEKK